MPHDQVECLFTAWTMLCWMLNSALPPQRLKPGVQDENSTHSQELGITLQPPRSPQGSHRVMSPVQKPRPAVVPKLSAANRGGAEPQLGADALNAQDGALGEVQAHYRHFAGGEQCQAGTPVRQRQTATGCYFTEGVACRHSSF